MHTANILLKVGEAEKRLGLNEKEFVNKSSDCLLQPLKSFLEGQMKTIQVRQIKCQNSICIVATYWITCLEREKDFGAKEARLRCMQV